MFFPFDIGIFGGDLRQIFMTELLLQKGYKVATYGILDSVMHENCSTMFTLRELFENCRFLIGPIPLSRDQIIITASNELYDLTIAHMAYLLKKDHILMAGNIPSPIINHCNKNKILYYDLMKNEKITIRNAIATAEGSIMEAISNSDRNLHGSNTLILGYGRCAKVLAQKLKALDAWVTVVARNEEALAYAEAAGHQTATLSELKCILPSCHFIFNTIPSLILDQECLDLVDPQALIIDIASAPGGVDFNYANNHQLNARLCLGLPGKIAPRTTADILVTEINSFIKERSD